MNQLEKNEDVSVELSIRWILVFLISVEMFLLTMDLGVYFYDWLEVRVMRELFDVTLEANIPSWFSSFQFLMIGLTCFLVSRYHRAASKSWRAGAWVLIALFFVFLSIDDTATIHESLGTLANKLGKHADKDSFHVWLLDSFPSFYWQVFVLPFFAVIGLAIAGFFLKEFDSRPFYLLFVTGMALFVVAIALDYYDGLDDYKWFIKRLDMEFKAVQHLSRAFEETIEMIGASLILTSLLAHLRSFMLNQSRVNAFRLTIV